MLLTLSLVLSGWQMSLVAAKEKEIERLKAKLEAELDESKDKVKLNPKEKEALRKLKIFLK